MFRQINTSRERADNRATVQGGPADPMVLVGAAQIEIPSMQQAAHYPGLAMVFFF